LKWYRPEYVRADRRLWDRLKEAINRGFPTESFLWPFDLVTLPRSSALGGYLMPIKEPRFVSLVDLLTRKSEPSFRALANLGFHLAHSFLHLHAHGLCYRDINFGNIFFDPTNGDVRIGDTDNVDVDRTPGGIMGTWGFMAPEVARLETEPSSMSDRFSLAVLLFYIFMLGHPLKGKRETELAYDGSDPDGSRRLCATDPLFVYDPGNESNRPVPGLHDAIINFWPLYPQSLREMFTRGFTQGLHDPESRIMDNDWRKEFARLKDSVFYCAGCTAENFFDIDRLRASGSLAPCWACGRAVTPPPRMRIGHSKDFHLVMLSPGAQLFPHHLEGDTYNFSPPLAEVVSSPFGLKNLSRQKWTARVGEQTMLEVPPGAVLKLDVSCRIHFGRAEADVKI
jgi:DNA-binding helix-hairpin-helix protein with protein kinase domain